MHLPRVRAQLLVWGVVAGLLQSACTASPPVAPPFRIAVVLPSAATDLAFSQSMWEALEAVRAAHGDEDAVEVASSEGVFQVSDATAALRGFAQQGYDLVIAHGTQYGPAVQELAPEFPGVSFAWGTASNTFGQPNVFAYGVAAEEGGYVNGVLAASLTHSKRIGVTGPVEEGEALRYVQGFEAGVRATDPTVQVHVTWTGSYSDETLMTEAANVHIAAGADVLTGSSQAVAGAIAAASAKGDVLWLGTQWEQSSLAPSLVVASQKYDWTQMLEEMMARVRSGTRGGDTFTLTLANDGLELAYNPGYAAPADARAAADAAQVAIEQGQLDPLP